ncbi:MAG TPA: sugar ABC transporter permease [Rubricoccaceae bacterium]|nr:sugar ABC transporter permease [Rubricoccaceae bacterium]
MLEPPKEGLALDVRDRSREQALEGQVPPAPRQWLGERARYRLFLSMLLLPTAVVMLAVVAFPFLYNVLVSFSNMNIYTLRSWHLIGPQQYVAVFREPAVWAVFGKTIVWTLVNVAFHVALGVFLAVVLHQKFVRGKPIWRVLLVLPWAVPSTISALTWRGMFNYEYGAVNLLITKVLRAPPIEWLTSPFEAFLAVILTNIWMGFPFMMVVALGGLQSIPQELYEAADVDGATAWQKFRTITAPLLKPVMVPAITLGVVWTFNNVNVVWLVTNGGEPNDQTHILVSYVYEAAFFMYRFGWAAALSMVIFALLFTFTQVFLNRTKATESVY